MRFEQQVADYEAALSWVSRLMSSTVTSQFGQPTPCDEFTVRDLLGHLLGTAYRGLGTARGESTRHVPHVITDVPGVELAPTYAHLAGQIGQAWRTVAARCRPLAAAVVPERLRGVMYDQPIRPTDDAGPSTQLARLLGHR